MNDLDFRAIGKGAGAAAAIAVPAGIVQNLLDRGSSAAFATFLIIMLALCMGGFIAGREAPDRAMTHGGLAALIAYLVVQVLGAISRLARGDTVTWIAIPLIAMLSMSCGVVGGYIAFRRSAKDDTETKSKTDVV